MKNKFSYYFSVLVASIGLGVAGAYALGAGPPTPGTWFRAGPVSFGSGFHLTDITNTITALAGGAQSATATNLTIVDDVTTVASSNDSITLPAPLAPYGRQIFISNSAASNALKLFVVTPGTVNGIATATGYSLAAGKAAHCISVSSTNWQCAGP